MKVRFWGTRGSIARPSRETIRFGGNTSCVEIRDSGGTVIVVDCGTGAYGLGKALMEEFKGPVRGHLFISHTHWDHIQGFPFFAPLFHPGSEWDIYAPGGRGAELEKTLAGQMSYSYFPIGLEAFASTVRFHDLAEGELEVGDINIKAFYLNHPTVTLGYRFTAGGRSVVYSADHEPHSPYPSSNQHHVHNEDLAHIEFLRGADLVIHDTQYTEEEYPDKIGWGHTPVERAVEWAMAAGIRQLALYHHDPARTDAMVDQLLDRCRRTVADAGSTMDVVAAWEGLELDLEEVATTARARYTPTLSARITRDINVPGTTVLIVDDDPDIVAVMKTALEPEGIMVIVAIDGLEGLEIAKRIRPKLMIVDWWLPSLNGLELVRRIRQEKDKSLSALPIVMVTASKRSGEDMAAGFDAGVTDYLLKPFKPAYLRSRVRGWILRGREKKIRGTVRTVAPTED